MNVALPFTRHVNSFMSERGTAITSLHSTAVTRTYKSQVFSIVPGTKSILSIFVCFTIIFIIIIVVVIHLLKMSIALSVLRGVIYLEGYDLRANF